MHIRCNLIKNLDKEHLIKYLIILIIVLFIIGYRLIDDLSVKKFKEKLNYTSSNSFKIDDFVLNGTSRYGIYFKNDNYQIGEYVAKIGYDDKCIVILQYDLDHSKDVPNYSNPNYYIIKRFQKSEENGLDNIIGPLNNKEFKKNVCSKVKMYRSWDLIATR